jgi:hypothetical protein
MVGGITMTFDPVCLCIEATTGVLTGTFTGTTPGTVTGTFASDALPRQTQGLVRIGTNTVVNGRRLRGRLFIPGPGEGDNDTGGTPSSGYTTAVTSAFAGLLTVGATTSLPVVWHRPGPGGAGASSLWTSVTTAPTWSVLRSRRG